MTTASAAELQMLELMNAARADAGLDPLKLATDLNESSETHSEWMLETDTFSHTGAGGSSAGERMTDAGFVFSGDWGWAENVAWQSERGEPGLSDDVEDLFEGLMDSPGHRANILSSDFEYVGIGIETGDFEGWDAVMVTQNFAATDAEVVLDTGPRQDAPAAAPEPAPEPAPQPAPDVPVAGSPGVPEAPEGGREIVLEDIAAQAPDPRHAWLADRLGQREADTGATDVFEFRSAGSPREAGLLSEGGFGAGPDGPAGAEALAVLAAHWPGCGTAADGRIPEDRAEWADWADWAAFDLPAFTFEDHFA